MILLKMEEIRGLGGFGRYNKLDLLVHNGKARHCSRDEESVKEAEKNLWEGIGIVLDFWYPEICEHVRKNYPEELL